MRMIGKLAPGKCQFCQKEPGPSWGLALASLAFLLFSSTAIKAEEKFEKVFVSSFAGWKYASTDKNSYLEGTEDGNYENVDLALALTSSPAERLRISGQIEMHTTAGEDEEDVELELDYIFASWAFSDHLNLKVGRAKHPFGIYAEIFDVGTLRPFFDLPQAVYGAAGVAGENYDGLGLGIHRSARNWDIDLDIYAGRLGFEVTEPWAIAGESEEGEAPGELEEAKNRTELLGLRLTLTPPVPGWSFGLSSYSGLADADEVLEGDEEDGEDELRHTAFGLHAEYDRESWTLRGEYTFLDEEEELEHEGFYLEVAYRLTRHWQIAARFDRSDTEVLEVDTAGFDSVTRHRDLALGINYWWNTHFVLKAALHRVDGNRFAIGEDLADEGLEELDDETTLFEFGAQLSF